MKKSLIALAVLAAAGAACAQSSVQLYGVADVWFGSAKTSGTRLVSVPDGEGPSTPGAAEFSNRQTQLDSGGVNTSRWGLKGTEDLGAGLKANFQLEQGFNVDTGAAQDSSKAFSRQAWVGLSGGFGEVQLGKVWTSYDDVRAAANDTFNANIAASNRTWLGYSDRTDNGIKYISPSYSGFSGSLTLAFGEDKTDSSSASSVTSLGLHYANGPLVLGFAHQQQKQNGAGGVFSALPPLASEVVSADILDLAAFSAAVRGKTTYNLLNGSYNFGPAKLVAGYNHVKQDIDGWSDSLKGKEFNLGVEVPLASNLNLGLGYAQSKVEDGGDDFFKSTGYTGALVYSLSKRTSVYGALTQSKLQVEDTPLEAKSTIYAVGLNHKF